MIANDQYLTRTWEQLINIWPVCESNWSIFDQYMRATDQYLNIMWEQTDQYIKSMWEHNNIWQIYDSITNIWPQFFFLEHSNIWPVYENTSIPDKSTRAYQHVTSTRGHLNICHYTQQSRRAYSSLDVFGIWH